ncbi:MAG TPA: energy transducer TonB [Candidatus Polarisedimenticolia bacterium]|jgi:TonB family protein
MNRLALCLASSGLLAVATLARAESEVIPPERIFTARAHYPEQLRKKRVEGTCVLEMVIDGQGRVDRVQPLRVSPGGEDFINPAIDAICRWRYKPATQSGRPVKVYMTAIINFTVGAGSAEGPEPAGLVQPPDPGSRECPEPSATAAPPPREPDPMGGPAAIDLSSGGPGRLVLGASLEEADAALPGAARREEAGGGMTLKAPSLGIEAHLEPGPDGGMAVRSIRYVFEQGREGFAACPYRTAPGMGKGKLCLGIEPAHGAPSRRRDFPGEGRRLISILEYDLDDARAVFTCVDRWIAELLIEGAPPTSP